MNKLKDLKVTVQSIVVDTKSMTLAVFRQLPVARIYKKDYSIRDVTLWGIVKYQITTHSNSVWVVFENDGILYKGSFDLCSELPIFNTSIDSLKIDVENLKSDIKHIMVYEKDQNEIPELKERLIKEQLNLLKYINAEQSVKKIESLPQLFIAV
jgi:hypothetical protein